MSLSHLIDIAYTRPSAMENIRIVGTKIYSVLQFYNLHSM